MQGTTRLIIKNLPANVTEDKLRDVFGKKGLITDVQLKYTPEGKFRGFAFIGYQNAEETQSAIKDLNKSRLGVSKIIVEPCTPLGDARKPKSWSKYAADSTAYKRIHPKPKEENKNVEESTNENDKVDLLEKYKNDSQFEEFLQVHSSDKVQHLLDERLKKDDNENEEDLENNTEKEKLANQEISDLEYMKQLVKGNISNDAKNINAKSEKETKKKYDLFIIKLHGLPFKCKKKDLKDFFRPTKPFNIRLPRNINGIAYATFKKEKSFKQALLKDKKGKQISVMPYANPITGLDKGSENSKNSAWTKQKESLENEESIAESGRIFVRNLAYVTTEDDMEKLFSQYGPLTEVNLPIDSFSRKTKGFGYITFVMPEHAVKAYTQLDGSIFHGRMLHLLPAKAKEGATTPNVEESGTSFKKQKATKDKAKAGSSHNWNSLFLGQNAVANVIADTYGTTKEAVLDPHGTSNAAVRLALGETLIITNTRKHLEEEGVHLDSFDNTTGTRSKTIILVKNLPAETTALELRQLFEKFGVIGRIILPPSCITAIVEFVEPSEARKAFVNLAYTKFKYLPLYLEWAPENSLGPSMKPVKVKDESVPDQIRKNISDVTGSEINETAVKDEENEEVEEETPEPDTTLFVKNLNFKTTDNSLREHFEKCGKVYYANVAAKKDVNDPNKRLSMGYGFVKFVHKTSTNLALKTLQSSNLDGKSIELKRSERTLPNEVQTRKKQQKATKQTGTKILVRNVPFQAKKKEINELFQAFGEIKALRLPKKMSTPDQHRGFAFVEYFTNSDAKKAFDALSQSTHLYGRRLVLEWASSEEGVEEIRKRTADHFHPTEIVKSKKSVLSVEDK